MRGIVALLDRMGCTMMLMAPTGRAAKRLGELCGREAHAASTRLGLSPGRPCPRAMASMTAKSTP